MKWMLGYSRMWEEPAERGGGCAVGAEGFPASSLGPGPSRGAPGSAEGSAVRIKGGAPGTWG